MPSSVHRKAASPCFGPISGLRRPLSLPSNSIFICSLHDLQTCKPCRFISTCGVPYFCIIQHSVHTEIKKLPKINQKHTIFKNYFCNPECSKTRLEQCRPTIFKTNYGHSDIFGGTIGEVRLIWAPLGKIRPVFKFSVILTQL